MSNSKKESDAAKLVSSDNIFRIADELVRQVNRTKKIVLIMILAVIIAVPLSWHLAPFVKGVSFRLAGYTTIAVAIIFIGIGARQWHVLSQWTTKYKRYKELQDKVDKELDFEKSGHESTTKE